MAKEISKVAKAGLLVYGHIDPVDSEGQEVPIADGTEIYSSSDETLATVVTNPKNPKYFIATLTGKIGDVQIRVNLNADPNSNDPVDQLADAGTIHCLPDLATDAGMTFDDSDTAPDVTGQSGNTGSGSSTSSGSTTSQSGSTGGDTSAAGSSGAGTSSGSTAAPSTTPLSFNDSATPPNTIVVNAAGSAPATGDSVTVNGSAITSPASFSLSNGGSLFVGSDSKVVSYSAPAGS